MTPTRPPSILACPICHVGMLPDELTCGRCARWKPIVTRDEVEQGDLFFSS